MGIVFVGQVNDHRGRLDLKRRQENVSQLLVVRSQPRCDGRHGGRDDRAVGR